MTALVADATGGDANNNTNEGGGRGGGGVLLCPPVPPPTTNAGSNCRVHTSCQRADCEFRRLPWELSAQVEVQRRCALNLKRRNERRLLMVGANFVDNGDKEDDDDFNQCHIITEEHLNQCIREQKEKEHAIQESFKKDVMSTMPREFGARVDPKTGRILERIERVLLKGSQRAALRVRQLNQSLNDSDESEDDCIDNDGSAEGGARACWNCDATRSTRWHEHEVEKFAMDVRGRQTNEVIGTVITLTCEECHSETLKKAAEENASSLSCARCDEESESEEGDKEDADAKTLKPRRNYYEGTNGDTLCLKCYRVDYGKYIANLREEREKVKNEEMSDKNTSKFLANRVGVRLKNAPKWARTSILRTTYGIAILPPPEGAKEYPKDWCACCERPKDPESRSQWGMSKTVFGASLCHNCYRVELEGFKEHGCVVCNKSWETNLYFRSKMNVQDFLCKDCFVAEKRKMFPELCNEERYEDTTTTTTAGANGAMNIGAPRSLTTPARRDHNSKGRKCCICAADQTSLAGWYFMRNAKNERVDGKYSCNRCYANFCRPGRPGRTALPADKIHQALTTSNGVIRYDMSEVRTAGTVAKYKFSTSGPAPRPKFRQKPAVVAPTPKNKIAKKQHQQQSQHAHPQKIKRVESAFQSDVDEDDVKDEDEEEDTEDDEDLIKCVSCSKGDNPTKLVLCDGCDAGHHTYCIGLTRVPTTPTWFCPTCKKTEMQKKSLTCTKAHPCVACGCIDENVENYTPDSIKSIDCFCRLCYERYHANIRNKTNGSSLPLDELLGRVFDKLPNKMKSEEAKAIDNVTISDKKNKWGSEQEWKKRVSKTSGLDSEAQALSTCWLPPPETKVRVRVPVARFTPVVESAVVKKTVTASHAMPPPPPRPRLPPPQKFPHPHPRPPPPSPPGSPSEIMRERNRQSAERSRLRSKAMDALRKLPKNKNKTDKELLVQLPKDLLPRIVRGAGSLGSPPSMKKPRAHFPPVLVLKKPSPSATPSYSTQMKSMAGPTPARQSVSNMPSIELAEKTPSDMPKEERIREALYRSNGRKKFVKEMLKRPEHKNKTDYELFAILPKDLQFRSPPPGFAGIVLPHGKKKNENSTLHSSSKKRKSLPPILPASLKNEERTKMAKPRQKQEDEIKGKDDTTEKRPPRKRPRLPVGNTEVAHRDGRTCVTCGSKTTPYGDWYRTEKGNENCKTYFCSRCAKIPANRLARGGVLTKKDLIRLSVEGAGQQPITDEPKKKEKGIGGIFKKIWTSKK